MKYFISAMRPGMTYEDAKARVVAMMAVLQGGPQGLTCAVVRSTYLGEDEPTLCVRTGDSNRDHETMRNLGLAFGQDSIGREDPIAETFTIFSLKGEDPVTLTKRRIAKRKPRSGYMRESGLWVSWR